MCLALPCAQASAAEGGGVGLTCLYCREPAELGDVVQLAEPLWCCSLCGLACHVQCYCDAHPQLPTVAAKLKALLAAAANGDRRQQQQWQRREAADGGSPAGGSSLLGASPAAAAVAAEAEVRRQQHATALAAYGEPWQERKQRVQLTTPHGRCESLRQLGAGMSLFALLATCSVVVICILLLPPMRSGCCLCLCFCCCCCAPPLPNCRRPGWDLRCVIVKTGDDCRQELLAMQLIAAFHEIFVEAQLPLCLRPYEVLPTSNRTALIEMVPNAPSIHAIKSKSPPGTR